MKRAKRLLLLREFYSLETFSIDFRDDMTTLKSLYILGSQDNNGLQTVTLLHILLGLTLHASGINCAAPGPAQVQHVTRNISNISNMTPVSRVS